MAGKPPGSGGHFRLTPAEAGMRLSRFFFLSVLLWASFFLMGTAAFERISPAEAQSCTPTGYCLPPDNPYCCSGCKSTSNGCGSGWVCVDSSRCNGSGQRPPPPHMTCPTGQYFCPGEIQGCCPYGWECDSTSCIKRH
jgi:hypothetical protein